MTDRHIGYVVTLDATMRADDSQRLLDLIAHLKGVASVAPIVLDMHTEIAKERAFAELRAPIASILWPHKP